MEEDERNLAYVAMTRAKHHLVLSQAILDVLKKNGVRHCIYWAVYSYLNSLGPGGCSDK